jgi:hypothetical protein
MPLTKSSGNGHTARSARRRCRLTWSPGKEQRSYQVSERVLTGRGWACWPACGGHRADVRRDGPAVGDPVGLRVPSPIGATCGDWCRPASRSSGRRSGCLAWRQLPPVLAGDRAVRGRGAAVPSGGGPGGQRQQPAGDERVLRRRQRRCGSAGYVAGPVM